jgi:toxin ParE1/3/4
VPRTVYITPRAESEIRDAFLWYESKRQELGVEFVTEIQKGLDRIVESPAMYPVLEDDVRGALVRRFP